MHQTERANYNNYAYNYLLLSVWLGKALKEWDEEVEEEENPPWIPDNQKILIIHLLR